MSNTGTEANNDAAEQDETDLECVDARAICSALQVIDRWQHLAAQPARDTQLALIWPPWNALGNEMRPEEKLWILTGGLPETNRGHRDRLDKLRMQFPYLPFHKQKFNQALAKVAEWSNRVRFSESTFRLHRELIERQLSFPNFDDVNTGRVAIYRATNELNLTHPGFLQCPAPTLADIEHLKQCYANYLGARGDAINLLRPLVFLPSLHEKHGLPPEEQALGLPHPPPEFPNHIYIARLAGYGKCTQRSLATFFADSFLKLSRHQMDEFCNEYHSPSKWRNGKYVFLAVWLADNAPVFRAFKATWPEILDAAKTHFNPDAPHGYRDCPDGSDNLKVWWKDHEKQLWPGQSRRISPPTGRPRLNSKRSDWHSLLTSLPFVPAGKG